jgi:hypothetical protein
MSSSRVEWVSSDALHALITVLRSWYQDVPQHHTVLFPAAALGYWNAQWRRAATNITASLTAASAAVVAGKDTSSTDARIPRDSLGFADQWTLVRPGSKLLLPLLHCVEPDGPVQNTRHHYMLLVVTTPATAGGSDYRFSYYNTLPGQRFYSPETLVRYKDLVVAAMRLWAPGLLPAGPVSDDYELHEALVQPAGSAQCGVGITVWIVRFLADALATVEPRGLPLRRFSHRDVVNGYMDFRRAVRLDRAAGDEAATGLWGPVSKLFQLLARPETGVPVMKAWKEASMPFPAAPVKPAGTAYMESDTWEEVEEELLLPGHSRASAVAVAAAAPTPSVMLPTPQLSLEVVEDPLFEYEDVQV